MAKKRKQYTLAQLAKLASSHASKDGSREHLMHVYMQVANGEITLGATDGHTALRYRLDKHTIADNEISLRPDGTYRWERDEWIPKEDVDIFNMLKRIWPETKSTYTAQNGTIEPFGISPKLMARALKSCDLYYDDGVRVDYRENTKPILISRESRQGEVQAECVVMPRLLLDQ